VITKAQAQHKRVKMSGNIVPLCAAWSIVLLTDQLAMQGR